MKVLKLLIAKWAHYSESIQEQYLKSLTSVLKAHKYLQLQILCHLQHIMRHFPRNRHQKLESGQSDWTFHYCANWFRQLNRRNSLLFYFYSLNFRWNSRSHDPKNITFDCNQRKGSLSFDWIRTEKSGCVKHSYRSYDIHRCNCTIVCTIFVNYRAIGVCMAVLKTVSIAKKFR